MQKYRTHTLGLVVSPVGEPITSEQATHVSLNDEGAGAYVVVTQPYVRSGNEGIAFDATEWPEIRRAIETMLAVSQGIEARPLPEEAQEE